MHSTETFYVENLKGGRCNRSIRQALLKEAGVHEVTVIKEQAKVCILGIGLNRFLLAEKLAVLGFPVQGASNNLLTRVRSLVLCWLGSTN
jgi:hypothetical protein